MPADYGGNFWIDSRLESCATRPSCSIATRVVYANTFSLADLQAIEGYHASAGRQPIRAAQTPIVRRATRSRQRWGARSARRLGASIRQQWVARSRANLMR